MTAGDDSGSTYYVDPEDSGRGKKDFNLPPKPLELCLDYLDQASLAAAFSKSCQDADLCPCGGVDLGEVVGHVIDSASTSVDVCVMELQDFTVSDALIKAFQSGIAVRIIVDDSYGDGSTEKAVEQMEAAGLTLHVDPSSNKLMHSKFVVIDDQTALVSSGNFSTYDAASNANNLLLFRSAGLAQGLKTRFDQMWFDSAYYSLDSAGPFSTQVAGDSVQWYFGPSWAMIDALKQAIAKAEKAVHFSIFSFTLEEVKDALLARCGQIEISGVYDGGQANGDDSQASWGWCPQATVRQADVGGDFGFTKLHHKYLIADPGLAGKERVVTGSANWSYSAATKNSELMVIVEAPDAVAAYESEFQARLSESQ